MDYIGRICPECFSTRYARGGCPDCGYREDPDQDSSRCLRDGTVLKDRYVIGRILGEGGFGITYKAYDLEHGTLCAMKEYAPVSIGTRAPDRMRYMPVSGGQMGRAYQRGLERFYEEAGILSSLNHVPGIVNILDFFQDNGTAYIVMEFLRGTDLKHLIQMAGGRGLPFRDITDIFLQLCDTLDRVHTEGHILHRDISPDNIYLTTENGRQKVTLIDFGSAKQVIEEEKRGFSVVLKRGYAPPEQYGTKTPQANYTDVYALACCYYHALSGVQVPMAPDRLGGQSYEPLWELVPDVPRYVSDAVDRALVLDYSRRTQQVREFGDVLRRALNQGGSGMQPPPPPPPQPPYQPAPPPPKPGQHMVPFLEIIGGKMQGWRWKLKPDTNITIGTRAECDVSIGGHNDVSRSHLVVLYDSGKNLFFLRDPGSTNGTRAYGTVLKHGELYSASPGAELALGYTGCVIRLTAQPAG